MQIPRTTYRFQFNEHFRLPDALALVPYLHELGLSHVYASPLFKAAPHSTHGYDVCDFTQLNPELGTEADLEKLVTALHWKKMGLVLDIVPNHMGIGTPENISWWDVLTYGEKSKFAHHFDIDWESSHENLRGKILIPILGDDYETLLNKGELQLLFENGKLFIGYQEHRFPLAPKTISKLPKDENGLKKFNSNFAAIDKLIRQQKYLLEFHAHGDAQLNYRRFFAVSSLAAVCVEDEKVFHGTHSLIRKWIEKGWLDGLRVDHPDGLRDPKKYLQRLRALAPDAWIVVEKILEPEELLPETWPVQGTTGYDFLNQLNGLFVDAASEKAFTDFYAEFTGETTDYAALVREKKRAVLKTILVAELNRLTALLAAIAAGRKEFKKISRAQWRDALAEIIVCFPVYRSYVAETNGATTAADIAVIKLAVHLACEERQDIPPTIFAFIHALLLKPQGSVAAKNFVARFQQLTGPVMAKGVEDTVFYCFNRFTSLNEVGGDPKIFGTSIESFHKFLSQQQKHWPHSELTTSTHDTKRAEDVRARLNVLSEIPETWAQTLRRWSKMNECHRQNNLPDRNAEYLFYQTLAGAWPLSEERAQFYMEKAAHESKQHTTWTNRNEPYEKALRNFVSETLRDPQFTTDLEHFTSTLATAAAANSLSQTLIKLIAPGVPDIYQGCELWDLSLVDPDNRRPVDFGLRQKLLAESKNLSAEKLWARRAEGLPKLWLIQKTLRLRGRLSDFDKFSYEPILARGAKAENVFAFSRGGKVIPIVPRFVLQLKNDWQNTSLELPPGKWRNEFTGESLSGELRMENMFRKFPVALLAKREDD
jgi:(1->4)-alpha-D-glucan 1-alpha-D-glucosylmutase